MRPFTVGLPFRVARGRRYLVRNTATARVVDSRRMVKKPIAVFKGEEHLRKALARSQGSMALEGLRMTLDEEKVLADAIRKGLSMEEYLRQVEDEIFWAKART